MELITENSCLDYGVNLIHYSVHAKDGLLDTNMYTRYSISANTEIETGSS